jgi:branched-chain amino acid transport system ATP-binding protein
MILEVRDLHAYYGQSHILHGVAMDVNDGEIVSLLGRNGVGRSTACKSIMGLVTAHGTVRFKGKDIAGLRPDQVAHRGVGYVPEDRQIFPTLTVRQNLELGLKRSGKFGRWNFDDVFALFPNLKARQDTSAGVLSGGEQQMLTMCRTLMGDPDLMLIDEPTEGLAPKLVEQVGELLAEIARRGVSVLLVEQKLAIALKISSRLYVMGHGCIVFEGTPADLGANSAVRREGDSTVSRRSGTARRWPQTARCSLRQNSAARGRGAPRAKRMRCRCRKGRLTRRPGSIRASTRHRVPELPR